VRQLFYQFWCMSICNRNEKLSPLRAKFLNFMDYVFAFSILFSVLLGISFVMALLTCTEGVNCL